MKHSRIGQLLLSVFLLSALLLTSACGQVKTKDQVEKKNEPAKVESSSSDTESTKQDAEADKAKADAEKTEKHDPVKIRLLAMSYFEKDLNVVRDMLAKAGFEPEVIIQPDYSSWASQVESGNYDLSLGGWSTVTGNPDYAVRSLFRSDGDYNIGINNPEVDKLIDQAASETPEQYQSTYKQLEDLLVTDQAYIVPFYSGYLITAVNKDIVKPESIYLKEEEAGSWNRVRYVNDEDNATRAYTISQQLSDLTSLDPVKANDGSINLLNSNLYVRLVNLTRDDKVVPSSSLSYNFAISEDRCKFYFLLRDDIHFARLDEGKAVDTGDVVGGEDVVFSLHRAMDKNSVPDHRTYTLYSQIKDVTQVTDLAVLDSKTADGRTVAEVFADKAPGKIEKLTDKNDQVDNPKGVYQVVCVETNEAFPQILNFLAHQSAGIVSKKQVEKMNTFKVEEYDREKDIAYGDSRTIAEGDHYDNQLMASGPYLLVMKDDYKVDFVKNPHFMPGTECEPTIDKVTVRFIADADSALSALRNDELYYGSVPPEKLDIVEKEAKFEVSKHPDNSCSYGAFNIKNSAFSDVNLRKAVLYAIDQDAFISVYNGLKRKCYSTVTPLVDTGNELIADAAKVSEYLDKYYAEKK